MVIHMQLILSYTQATIPETIILDTTAVQIGEFNLYNLPASLFITSTLHIDLLSNNSVLLAFKIIQARENPVSIFWKRGVFAETFN